MSNQKQYIQDCNDVVYKVMPSHYLKLSPWNDGEDRRVNCQGASVAFKQLGHFFL